MGMWTNECDAIVMVEMKHIFEALWNFRKLLVEALIVQG